MIGNVRGLIRKFGVRRYKPQWGTLIAFLVLWTIFIVGAPKSFLGTSIYTCFMATIPFLGILALPLTLVIITGEIDLSFASVMGFCGWVFAAVLIGTGSVGLALLSSLAVGLAAGLLNGIIITKFRVPSLIMTLGAMFFWRGATVVCCGGWGSTLVSAKGSFFRQAIIGRVGGVIPAQALWVIAFAVVLWLILNRHRIGAHIYCIGDNIEAARMMGINVDRVKIFTFALLGIFAAFAATVVNLEMLYLWPQLGEGYLLPVIAAVFFGGTSPLGGSGTIFGTCVGIVTIGMLEAGVVAVGLSGFWTKLFCGLIIILSVIFHSFLRRRE